MFVSRFVVENKKIMEIIKYYFHGADDRYGCTP